MRLLKKFNIIKNKKDLNAWFSLLISTVGIRFIGLFRGLFVARVLGPSDFGLLSSLLLINSLNKYGSLGFNAVVKREVPFFEGKDQVQLVKNVAYSSEMLLGLFLLFLGCGSTLFIKDYNISLAVTLASLGLFFGKLAKITRTEIIVEKKFVELAKYNIYIEIFIALSVILTVSLLGIFSSLIFSVIGSIIAILIFRNKVKFSFRFLIDWKECLRQLKIGIPIALSTIAYGSYRYSEKLVILFFLGSTPLGLFAVCEKMTDALLNVFMVRYKNLSISISNALGEKKYVLAHKTFLSNTLLILFFSLIIIPVIVVLAEFLFPLLLGDSYPDVVPILKVFIFIVPIRTIGGFTIVFLESPLINKQNILPFFQCLSTLIFIFTVSIINYSGTINIINIIYADIIGYAFWHFSLLVLYYKYFFFNFVK